MLRFPVRKAFLVPHDVEQRRSELRQALHGPDECLPWFEGYELRLEGNTAFVEAERGEKNCVILSFYAGKDVAHCIFEKQTASCVTAGANSEEIIDVPINEKWSWKLYLPYGSTAVHVGFGLHPQLSKKW